MKIFPIDNKLLTVSNILLIYRVLIKLRELNAVWAMDCGWECKTHSAPLRCLLRASCVLQAMPFSLGEALWPQCCDGRAPAGMCVGSLCAVPKRLEAPSQWSPAAHVWHSVPRLNLIANCNKCLLEFECRGICVSVGTGRNPVRAVFISHSPWELPRVRGHLAPMDCSIPCCSTKPCWASYSSGKTEGFGSNVSEIWFKPTVPVYS